MSQFTDDLQAQLDDINQAIEDNSQNLQDYSDQNDSNLQDFQTTLDTLSESSGQLTFPLSQDTIDLIDQQAPTIIGYLVQNNYIGTATLVAGTVTVLSSNITATSLFLISPATKGGTQGALSYVANAGQVVITSTSNTDTSTVVYFQLN